MAKYSGRLRTPCTGRLASPRPCLARAAARGRPRMPPSLHTTTAHGYVQVAEEGAFTQPGGAIGLPHAPAKGTSVSAEPCTIMTGGTRRSTAMSARRGLTGVPSGRPGPADVRWTKAAAASGVSTATSSVAASLLPRGPAAQPAGGGAAPAPRTSTPAAPSASPTAAPCTHHRGDARTNSCVWSSNDRCRREGGMTGRGRRGPEGASTARANAPALTCNTSCSRNGRNASDPVPCHRRAYAPRLSVQSATP